jgi:muconolactone delta-isomerase
MKWKIDGRISLKELWEKEVKEAEHAHNEDNPVKLIGIWKVASQRRIIAVVDAPDADALDRNTFSLPLAEYLEFEHVWALRDYSPFIEDCKKGFKF